MVDEVPKVFIATPIDWGFPKKNVILKNITDEGENKTKTEKRKTPLDKTSKMSDFIKYPVLSKYIGLVGEYPCRADTTYVGVEIEMERVVQHQNPPPTFKTTEDHSLKYRGKEFVTIPIQLKFLEVELLRLFSSLNKYNFSSRCSIHVHLNARDFTVSELKTFILLYMVFERGLYRFSGDRWNNNFCVPLHFYLRGVEEFLSHINEDSPENIEMNFQEENLKWWKYFGLNISPLFGGESTKIGTVEFRHMIGNDNIPHILEWINLLVSLKIAAKKYDFNGIKRKILEMNTDSSYFTFAEDIFRNFHPALTKQETFKDDVESCISSTKLVISSKYQGKYKIDLKIPESTKRGV